MEKTFDDLQWQLMVQNHFISSSHIPENQNRHAPELSPSPENQPVIWQNHLTYQNPTSSPQNPIYHDPLQLPFQTRLCPNPNPQNHLLLQENHHQLNYIGPLDSGLHLNPSFAEPLPNNYLQSLEAALNRMTISATTPSRYQPQYIENNSLANRGFPHLSYSQQQSLNRMRSRSAGLALRRANSTALSDSQYSLNQSFSDLNNSRFNLQRRSPSYNALAYGYSARANANNNRIRLDSGSQFTRARSVNGLEAANSNVLLSSLYNRPFTQSRKHSTYSSLEQVKGRVAIIARDQEGCRFLQKKIDEQIPGQIEMMFLELKDHLCDLIVDQFANYLIQKLFATCNEEQMSQLLVSLITNEQKLLDICIHPHGTRAVQKMMEYIRTPEQKSSFISALKNITVSLSKNHNGHHVIQQCFKHFLVDDTKYLLDEIANSCLDIAMDKSGCCVLQKSVTQAQGELKERLVAEITANALILSEHPYGNYVVQYVLEMNIPHAKGNILERLGGHYVTLSMNKYGSNVVEKCLKVCNEKNASRIIEELMHSPDVLEVLQDPFGNYVVQSALLVSKGDLHHALVGLINFYYPHLHSHLHGKKVLARTRGHRNRV